MSKKIITTPTGVVVAEEIGKVVIRKSPIRTITRQAFSGSDGNLWVKYEHRWRAIVATSDPNEYRLTKQTEDTCGY